MSLVGAEATIATLCAYVDNFTAVSVTYHCAYVDVRLVEDNARLLNAYNALALNACVDDNLNVCSVDCACVVSAKPPISK